MQKQDLTFQEDFFLKNKSAQRNGLIVLLVVACIFGLNQGGYTPSEHLMLLKIHYLFYVPLLLALIFAWNFAKSNLQSQAILTCGVLLTGATYIAMEQIAPTSSQSEASQTTVVLIVVVMAASFVFRMSFLYAVFCTWLLWGAYAICALAIFHMANGGWNVGAMAMGCVISTLNAWYSEQNARRIFLLSRSKETPRTK